jgi:hypothetical protein
MHLHINRKKMQRNIFISIEAFFFSVQVFFIRLRSAAVIVIASAGHDNAQAVQFSSLSRFNWC